MPSLNMPVQRLKVAILPLDLPCSGPVTHSGEILTTGKSHGKKPDRFSSFFKFYCYKSLHISDIFSAHHQEFSTVHSALVSFMQVFDDRFQAESGWNCETLPSLAVKVHDFLCKN